MRARDVCRVTVVVVACVVARCVPCAARPVFVLHPGHAPATDVPAALTSPGALAFLSDAHLAAVSGRWIASGATSPSGLDPRAPLLLLTERASSLAPSAAGFAVALGPHAGVSVAYLRTDDTFDASHATVSVIGHVDSADGTQSVLGYSVCDTYRASCGVRVAPWASFGLSVGAQQVRAHVRVARRQTLEDPPGAPATALARYDDVHDVQLTSRTTPLVAWGVALRPAPFVDVDIASRPSVAMEYTSVVSQVSGVEEVFYPTSQVFRSNQYRSIVSPADPRGRSDADVTLRVAARPHERVALGARLTHVTTYPVRVEPRGGGVVADRFLVEEPHRSDLWHADASTRVTRALTLFALWEQTLRAGWDTDGRAVDEQRLPAWGGGVDMVVSRARVRLSAVRITGDVPIAIPLPPSSAAAVDRLSDTRVTLTCEWR